MHVDGSFVTAEPVPKDVDIVLLFPESDFLKFATNQYAMMLANRAAVKRDYKVDVLLGPTMASMPQFFQGIRAEKAHELGVPSTHKKGILRVTL